MSTDPAPPQATSDEYIELYRRAEDAERLAHPLNNRGANGGAIIAAHCARREEALRKENAELREMNRNMDAHADRETQAALDYKAKLTASESEVAGLRADNGRLRELVVEINTYLKASPLVGDCTFTRSIEKSLNPKPKST